VLHQTRHRAYRRLAAMMLAVLLATLAVPSSTPSIAQTVGAGTVTGRVFQDFNADGAYDSTVVSGSATDIGVAGIVVRAFDSAGELVGTATSSADGTYSLSVTGAQSDDLRIEFLIPTTGMLANFEPSFAGSGNGTTVQFVTLGTASAEDVDLGINVPSEYCQSNPSLAVSRLCAGESFGAGAPADNPSVFVTRYDGGPYTTAHGFTDVYTAWPTVTAGQATTTGSILGMAWDPATRRVFNTAYVRRHAAMFELGGTARPGALFVTTPGASGLGGATEFLVDLETLMGGDQFSNAAGTAGDAGHVPTNAERQLECIEHKTAAQSSDPCYQKGADSNIAPAGQVGVYGMVGQVGIGDIEVDDDGDLYVVSLYTKHLYHVEMPENGTAPTTMTSLGDITAEVTCTNGEGRPFSVTRWRGALYLGLTCDGSGDFPANVADYDPKETLDDNITFTIRRYDLATGEWSTFFGPQSLSGQVRGSVDGTSNDWAETARRWNPWTNAYAAPGALGDTFGVRPVPMLSDIAFDADGSMILGFRDRNGDQLATNGSESPIGTNTNYPAIASGDILRVCRTGEGFEPSDYTFEGGTGCEQNVNAANGTEYYFGDKYFSFHYEVSVGMLKQVPGFPDVIMTVFDPFDGDGSGKTFYSGGTRYLRNATGGNAPSFPNAGSGVLYFAWDGQAGNPNTAGGFLKTNGMSDVEALCDLAPVQIGNRVWIDENQNGIQDPGEPSVAGVTLRLYDEDGVLVGTAITDEDGTYYFSSNVTKPAEGDGGNVGGGLTVGGTFTVRLDEPADYASGGPLEGYVLTYDFVDVEGGAFRTIAVDSNAYLPEDGEGVVASALYPTIDIPARLAGFNDHTFDVGFFLEPEAPVRGSDLGSDVTGPVPTSVPTGGGPGSDLPAFAVLIAAGLMLHGARRRFGADRS
jgi:hypothetical protein